MFAFRYFCPISIGQKVVSARLFGEQESMDFLQRRKSVIFKYEKLNPDYIYRTHAGKLNFKHVNASDEAEVRL